MENQKFSPAFEHALNFILRPDIEGVYVNDPTDRGGETKYGISDRRDGVIDGKTDVSGDGKPDMCCCSPAARLPEPLPVPEVSRCICHHRTGISR